MTNNLSKQKPSEQNKIIYQDDCFTFTYDDLYLLNTDNPSIYLNIDKYFNLYHSKLNNDQYANTSRANTIFSSKLRRNRFLYIGDIEAQDIKFTSKNIQSSPLADNYFDELSIEYYPSTSLKLIPGDLEADRAIPQSMFSNSYNLAMINVYRMRTFERMHLTDRHYRSSHQRPSAAKRFHTVLKNSRKVSYDQLEQADNNCSKAIRHYNKYLARAYNVVYKKQKPFHTIDSIPVFCNPLNTLLQKFFAMLQDTVKSDDVIYIVSEQLLNSNLPYKRKYRIARKLFLLLSLGRYDDAVSVLMDITSKHLTKNEPVFQQQKLKQNRKYKKLSKSNRQKAKAKAATNKPTIKINAQTEEIYNKKFSLLVHRLSSYTYKDAFDKETIIKVISNNISKEVKKTFEQYTKLYHLSTTSDKIADKNVSNKSTDDKQFIYTFYYNPLYNKLSGIPVSNKILSNFVIVKPKFI